jgi:hypothetical protein
VDYHLVGPSADLDVRALFSAISMLSSLGASGAQWTLLPVKVRYGLLVALCNVNVLSLEDTTKLIKAFNALKLTWPSLPKPLQDKLKHDLQKRVTTHHLLELVGCMHQLSNFHASKDFIPVGNINDALRSDDTSDITTRLNPRAWAVLVVSLANLHYSYAALSDDATQQMQLMLTGVIRDIEVLVSFIIFLCERLICKTSELQDVEKVLNALPLLTSDAAYVQSTLPNSAQSRVTQLWLLHETLLRGYRVIAKPQQPTSSSGSNKNSSSSNGDPDPLDGFTQIKEYIDFMTRISPDGRSFVRRVLCEDCSGYTQPREVSHKVESEDVFRSGDIQHSMHRRIEEEDHVHVSFDSGVGLA